MPVYNGERFLQVALDSVLGQTFHDFEFVVIDDGSTDGTPQILVRSGDTRLQVVRISHVGLVGALNEGVARCSGQFIARMDADDICRPNRLQLQADYLLTHPDVDVVTCPCDLIDEQGVVTGCKSGGVGPDMLLELAAGNGIVHGSIMVRRASLPPAPVYAGSTEDYRLWVRLLQDGRRFACVAETLYEFRTHTQRHSLTQARSQSAGIVDVQWPLLEECQRTRNPSDPNVRWCLTVGWGRVAGAAYCAGDIQRADTARRWFLDLASGRWDQHIAGAAREGIEAMIWGGCPWRQAWRLRWLEWRHRPAAWRSYRNLLLTLAPVQKLRALLRRHS